MRWTDTSAVHYVHIHNAIGHVTFSSVVYFSNFLLAFVSVLSVFPRSQYLFEVFSLLALSVTGVEGREL